MYRSITNPYSYLSKHLSLTVVLLSSLYTTDTRATPDGISNLKAFSSITTGKTLSSYKGNNSTAIISVGNRNELHQAIKQANKTGGNTIVVLSKGTYILNDTINIKASNITIKSRSGKPEDVIIQGGKSFDKLYHGNLIKVFADHFTLQGITLQYASTHAIQISGEHDADYPVIRDCIIQDTRQQLLKISYSKNNPENFSDHGLIENCVFRFTEGVARQFYTGGIDAHAINRWVIKNNQFKDIASPKNGPAEHAIHIWNHAGYNEVIGNSIEDCDRGIGFGLGRRTNNEAGTTKVYNSGIIRDNTIIHYDNEHQFADAGITLEGSTNTIVENNKIFSDHSYPNAIEYRFPSTFDITIKGNITNKKIISRNDAQATLIDNITNAGSQDIIPKRKIMH